MVLLIYFLVVKNIDCFIDETKFVSMGKSLPPREIVPITDSFLLLDEGFEKCGDLN